MQDAKELLPLATYSPLRLVIGCVIAALVIGWVSWVFWVTRRQKARTIATLGAKPIVQKDINALKKKYLGLIDEVAQQSAKRQLNNRASHQKLSLLVRLFAFEASGFRAQVMTLADISKGRFPALRDVIATYYPNEFDNDHVVMGSVDDALQRARQVVTTWQ